MKRTKILIAIVLLFMVIGFAAITTSLSINANMELLGNLDDFYIYYSRAVVDGEEDPSIIVSSTELDFGAALKTVGTPYVIEYDITNASTAFDAQIHIECNGSSEYFEITEEFDESTPLPAKQTRTGRLTLTKIKTLAGDDINNTVSCNVVATPIERESLVTGDTPLPIDRQFSVGTEITIGEEKFNIISQTQNTVTMLAQYNISPNYKQSLGGNYIKFANTKGWEYTPGPKDINIEEWTTNPQIYVNEYVKYLKTELEDDSVTGNLITLTELKDLGCTINDDYSYTSGLTCQNSSYKSWLINNQYLWTLSASSESDTDIWVIDSKGGLILENYSSNNGIRPTITMPVETVQLLLKQ